MAGTGAKLAQNPAARSMAAGMATGGSAGGGGGAGGNEWSIHTVHML
jgi:hypothetical protein